MKKIVALICCILIVGSCQDVKKPQRPENLIPKDTMVLIFTDTYLANAARNLNKKIIEKNKVALDSLIYKKYHIDSLRFATSNAYYSLDINTYTEILEKAEKNIYNKKTILDSLVRKNEEDKKNMTLEDKVKMTDERKRKKDSILKARKLIIPAKN